MKQIKRILIGAGVILAMMVVVAILKQEAPSIAIIAGTAVLILGFVALYRPLPQIGMGSRVFAVLMMLLVVPISFMDASENSGGDAGAIGAGNEAEPVTEEQREAERRRAEEEERLRREAKAREIEERQAAGARKLARLCGEDNASGAYVWSKTFVRQQLKAPSSATFPWSGKSEPLGDCLFRVVAYVEAQNSFGAQVRTYYEAKMKFNPVSEEWAMVGLKFEE